MSDTPGGPDWFKATDGKWYPPQPPTPQFTAQQKKSGCLKWGGITAGLFVILIIVAIAASGGSSNKSTTSTTAAQGALSQQAASSNNPAINDVSISKCYIDSQYGTSYAKADVAVTNHSSKTSNYTVTVAFDNPDGSQFDTGYANVETLAPAQSGSDTAQSKDGAASGITCKVTDVTRTAS